MNKFPSENWDNAEESLGLSFIKAYNVWHKMIKDALKDLNLTHPQFVVLTTLGYLSQSKEEVNQVDISKQSDIDVMTVSTIIKNLEKQQLITRKNSLKDTRAKVVMMNEKGSQILSKALPVVEGIDNIYFGKLGAKTGAFNELLQRLLGE